jgi:hypothetical protein
MTDAKGFQNRTRGACGAKVYPAKELEHGLKPNSQISQYIIPTQVSTIQR